MGFTISNIFILAFYLLVTLPLSPLHGEVSKSLSYTENHFESDDQTSDQIENDKIVLTDNSLLQSHYVNTYILNDESPVSLLFPENRLSFRYISIPPPRPWFCV